MKHNQMPKNSTPHIVSKIPVSAKIARIENALLKVRQLRAPPTNMDEIESESDKRVVNEVLIFINKLVKRTSQLENRMEVLDSYYKVHFEGFKERVSFPKLVEFQATQNAKYKWNVVRDVYCEMDTNRIVVEINKVCTKPYVSTLANIPAAPPVPEKLLDAKKKKKNYEHVDKNGFLIVISDGEEEEIEVDDGEYNEVYDNGTVDDAVDDDFSEDDDRRQFVEIAENGDEIVDHFQRPSFPVEEYEMQEESEISFSDATASISSSASPSRKRHRRRHRNDEIELNDDFTVVKRVRR